MSIRSITKFSTASRFAIVAAVVLLGAVFITVNSALEQQQTRSQAGIIYSGNYNGSLNGDNFTVKGSVSGDVKGNNNVIGGNVAGCLQGNKNIIGGKVSGKVTGSGNIIGGGYGSGPCLSSTQNTPSAPTPTHALQLTPTISKAPTPTPTRIVTLAPTPTKAPILTVKPTIAPTKIPEVTNTPVPGDTSVGINILLHGIGKGGDSANSNAQGNGNPLRPQREVTVEVFDVHNQLVLSKKGMVSYNSVAGNFSGEVGLGTQLNTGIFTIKVKTDQYLRGLLSGIQTITKGQSNNLPSVTLIAGDINNDNQINVLDYNILMGCYSDLLPPVSCNAANGVQADLNDDGNVNQFDYNFFLRELTNIGGQ